MMIETFRSQGESLKNVEILETPIASIRVLHETHRETAFDTRVMEGADLYCAEQVGSFSKRITEAETFANQVNHETRRLPLYEYAMAHDIPVHLVDSMVARNFSRGILDSGVTNLTRRVAVAGLLTGGLVGLMGLNTARHKISDAMSATAAPPESADNQAEPPPPPKQKDLIDRAVDAIMLPTLAYTLACLSPKLFDPALMTTVVLGLQKSGEIDITTQRYTAWRAMVRLRKFMDPDEFSYHREVRDMVMALKTITAIEEKTKVSGKRPIVVLNIGSEHSHHMKEYLALSQQDLAARIYHAAKELDIVDIVQEDIAKSASGVWDEAKKEWTIDAKPHPELEKVFAVAKETR